MTSADDDCAVVEGGLLKSLCCYTWPGIEYGEPPRYKHSFFEYVDALRLGDIARFEHIERVDGAWWSVDMDRGAGAALHFAADHGQLACVRFLVERRGAAVNQRDRVRGWTPLLRCAHMAHHTHAPFLDTFAYLLSAGADATLAGAGLPDPATGRGWRAGQVRERLTALTQEHAHVPKQPPATYSGGDIGPLAARVLAAWERRAPVVPPADWRPPPPAGYADAQGMRLAALEPWRPAGQDDGSCTLRAMTDAELLRQSQQAAEASARAPQAAC